MHSRLGRREADPQLWVNKLTVVVLTLTLLYLIVGIPEFNHSAATDIPTDAVDPIHRFAWLGLFAAAMPVAAKRWRETIGLLAACWPLVLLYLYFAISVSLGAGPRRVTPPLHPVGHASGSDGNSHQWIETRRDLAHPRCNGLHHRRHG